MRSFEGQGHYDLLHIEALVETSLDAYHRKGHDEPIPFSAFEMANICKKKYYKRGQKVNQGQNCLSLAEHNQNRQEIY